MVVQAVQHLIHPPVELAAWPDKDHASRVVFITRNIPERQVRDLFDQCAHWLRSAEGDRTVGSKTDTDARAGGPARHRVATAHT